MPSCVFRKCTNYDRKSNKLQGISYHTFPSDEVRLQDWIEIVRQERSELDWTPSNRSLICSNHFKATDKYVSEKGRTLLVKNAIPFIEDPKFNDDHNDHITMSPSSLDDVSFPEVEVILESPRESALRQRVRELTFQKKQLQKINKTLKQHNKRLKKRIALLKLK